NPKRAHADKALSDAIVLRLGLGQEDLAVADVKDYQKNYANTNATETAQIAFAIGAHYADKEDWDSARKALQGAMGTLDKAPPDIQVQAHATLARAMMHIKGSQPQAKPEYDKVRKLWADGAAAQAKIAEAYKGEGEDQRAHRLGKALDAVGEAIFFEAEDSKKAKVDSLPFPAYKGPATKDDILKYMDKKVKPWVQKKQSAIEEVDKDYQKVTELQPVPPPRWVIAAASRAGLMWGNFVDEFRAAPIPKEWAKDPEIRGTYYEHLDGASQPVKDGKAKPALKRCLDDSVKYQYFDEYSRDCEKWLAKNYKAEYHVVDELRGAPTLSNSGLEDRPPPLIIGGQLWHPVERGPATEKVEIAGQTSPNDEDKKKPAAGKKKK
ncbi:MAG: hypothetical protein FWD17_12725, partial [Polyangiaceae bacterium]|nr:hypothetical protein [Polyangiaceae bacterium]